MPLTPQINQSILHRARHKLRHLLPCAMLLPSVPGGERHERQHLFELALSDQSPACPLRNIIHHLRAIKWHEEKHDRRQAVLEQVKTLLLQCKDLEKSVTPPDVHYKESWKYILSSSRFHELLCSLFILFMTVLAVASLIKTSIAHIT